MNNSRVIFKYQLDVTDIQKIRLHKDAQILSIQDQHDIVCLWALVNLEAPMEERTIEMYGTGHDVPAGRTHLGSVQNHDRFVWHVFEVAG